MPTARKSAQPCHLREQTGPAKAGRNVPPFMVMSQPPVNRKAKQTNEFTRSGRTGSGGGMRA
jgi:hypothetical protein